MEDSEHSLGHAIRLATDAPDAEQALEGILEMAVHALPALAGAVVEPGRADPRALFGWSPGGLAPLLAPGGPVAEALVHREEWIDRPLFLPPGDAPPVLTGASAGRLLLIPLHVRALAVGALLLALPEEGGPAGQQWEAARAYAGVAALVLEHDRTFEEARKARQARDHFLTALNHEIRTPALALVLNADILRAYGEVPPRIEKVLSSTQTAIDSIVQVLEGVLQLGEKEVADLSARGDVIHPREAVLQLLRRVEPAADRKKLPISYHAPRDLPPLQTDAARFSRILIHLLTNAIKYTSEGRIEVRLERAARRVGPGAREPFLMVRVADTGRGIPREELERILEPFTQVEENARTDSLSRGVGLGLALARRLARSLGGELRLESEPGRGTVGSLFIPYHR